MTGGVTTFKRVVREDTHQSGGKKIKRIWKQILETVLIELLEETV